MLLASVYILNIVDIQTIKKVCKVHTTVPKKL